MTDTGRGSTTPISGGLPRPTFEDHLRAVGYLCIMLWAIVFLLYPPTVFVSSLDTTTRIFWLLITFVGAALAFSGSLSRIDIKLEFPGLLVTLIGPLFYFASQLYFVVFPHYIDQNGRGALIVYALLPGLLLLPRTYALYIESRRLKRIGKAAASRRRHARKGAGS